MQIRLEIIKHPELSLGNTWHLSPVRFWIIVKISGVSIVAHFWDDRRLQLFVIHLLPVH